MKPVFRLPPSAYRSLAFQAREDAAIWTRTWVGLGFATDISQAGDILPATVGNHGVHVERQADDTIVGRFNKAQHGGCRAVPLQCQTGTKTRCSFTACGYSRDRGAILMRDADRLRHLDQYLGLRPERLLTVATAMWGPVVAARLDPLTTAALDWPEPGIGLEAATPWPNGETLWLEREANWKHVLVALAANDGGVSATAHFPNVVVLDGPGVRCFIVLQPTALHRTVCRVRVFDTGTAGSALLEREALSEIRVRCERAEAWQADEPNVLRDGDAAPARAWLEDQVAAAFDTLDDEKRSGPLYRANDKGDC